MARNTSAKVKSSATITCRSPLRCCCPAMAFSPLINAPTAARQDHSATRIDTTLAQPSVCDGALTNPFTCVCNSR